MKPQTFSPSSVYQFLPHVVLNETVSLSPISPGNRKLSAERAGFPVAPETHRLVLCKARMP